MNRDEGLPAAPLGLALRAAIAKATGDAYPATTGGQRTAEDATAAEHSSLGGIK